MLNDVQCTVYVHVIKKISKLGHAVVCVILPLTRKDADVIFQDHLSAIHFLQKIVHVNAGDLFSVL